MKILYVEDEIAHVELTQRTLEDNLQREFELIHAETMKAALECLAAEPDIDLVLSDLRLPDGSGLDLLKKALEAKSHPAVVLVTGQGDQEAAVAALKAGAADYLVKQSDYLHRLPVVISNAVAQNRLLREQAALREAEVKYQSLVEQISAVVFLDSVDEEEATFYMSPRIQELTGYTADDWYADLEIWLKGIYPTDRERITEAYKASHENGTPFFEEYRFVRRDGRVVWLKEDTNLIRDKEGNPLYWQGILLDITKEKESEASLQRQVEELAILQAATAAGTESYSEDSIIETVTNILARIYSEVCGILVMDSAGKTLIPHPSYRGADVSDWRAGYPITQGITGRAASLGKVLRVGDVSKEAGYIEIASGIKSELCAPIQVHERVIGVINVESRRADAYDENDEKLLSTIAGGLGTALERLRLFQEQGRRSRIIETLADIANEIATTRDILPALDRIAQRALELLNANNVAIYLLQDDQVSLKTAAAHGIQRGQLLAHVGKVGEGITGNIFVTGRAEIVNNTQEDPRRLVVPGTPVVEERPQTLMSSPLILRGKPIGVINAWRLKENGLFNESELTFLVSIAHQVSICIESGRLFQETTRQAQEAAALAEVGRDISATLQLDTVLERIASYAKELLRAVSSAVYLADPATGTLRAIAALGVDAQEIKDDPVEVGSGILGNIALQEVGEIVNNSANDPRSVTVKGTEDIEIEHIMGAPILMREQHTGLLAVWRLEAGSEFEPRELAFLTSLARQAAVAIENARLYQSALQAAERRAVLHRISQEIARFTQDNEQIYKSIHEAAEKLMPCDVFMVTLRNETNDESVFAYTMESGTRYSLKNEPIHEGLSGKVIHKGAGIILENEAALEAEGFRRFGSPTRVRSVVAVPMRIGDRIIGVISAQSYKPNSYGNEEQALLEMLAAHAATALENARLFQEETRRAKIIETLANIANEIATTREIIPILDKITQRALELLRANHVAIYLLHDDNRTIKVISAQGAHREALLSRSLKIGEGITGNVIANGKPEIINDIDRDRRGRRVPGVPELDSQVESMMSSPLTLRGRAIGAINAWRLLSEGMFHQAELNFLINIGHQVSIAIESANLFQEAVQRAHEASAIAEVGREISATLNLDAVLERIASYARELLGAETSAVYLLEPQNQILKAVAVIGLDSDEIKSDPIEIGVGIVGSIARQKFGEIVNDTANDPRTITVKGTETLPNEHIMGAPVLSRDQLTGLLVVWRSGEDNEFKLTELHFLSALTHQAAVAIENARLYDETQRRLNELETINRLSTALRNTQSANEMVNILLDETLNTLDIDSGSIWIYDPATDELIQRAARGLPTQFKYTRLKPSEGIIGHVFSTGNAHISPEFINDPLVYKGNLDSAPPKLGGVCIPIQSSGGTIGALMIGTEKGRQIHDRIGLLTALAEITGNAIHRAELFEQSQDQIRKLTTLRDIDSAITSSTDLRVTMSILMDHTLKQLKADAVAILLYHPELQSLTYLCSAGFLAPSPSRPLMRLGEGLAGRVVMTGGIEHVPDLRNSTEARRDPLLAREGFVAYFGVPLIVKGEVKGVFEIFQRAPMSPGADWMQFLHTLAGQAAIAIDNAQLFERLQRSNQEITQAYDTTLEGWARALELRDRETEGHTRRVTDLTMQLARYMGIQEDELITMYRGVLLHDIGKMGVPDHILRKEDPLDESEWIEMRKHPEYAFNLLAPIPYLRPALDIPYCHHEHWDGSGYPRGLKGEEIPLAARIFSIVDIWDALLSDRPYRKAWPREKVIEYLKEISGKNLDPKIVIEFLKMIDEER